MLYLHFCTLWQTLSMVFAGTRKPFLGAEGLLHWPVLFFYPENMQSDAIEDFCEVETLADHLDVMFGTSSPPLEWDTDHLYSRSQLRLYYLSYAAAPLKADQLAQVRLAFVFNDPYLPKTDHLQLLYSRKHQP